MIHLCHYDSNDKLILDMYIYLPSLKVYRNRSNLLIYFDGYNIFSFNNV